jgi:hypothetical protein
LPQGLFLTTTDLPFWWRCDNSHPEEFNAEISVAQTSVKWGFFALHLKAVKSRYFGQQVVKDEGCKREF